MSEIVSSGAVFQPAVMPTGGWNGFTPSNNYQAVAVCKVMKQFTDQGVVVWLRFVSALLFFLFFLFSSWELFRLTLFFSLSIF